MRFFFFFLWALLLSFPAFAEEKADPEQAKIDTFEAKAREFQGELRDYYMAQGIPIAEGERDEQTRCMEKCRDVADPPSCLARCRGEYMRTTTAEPYGQDPNCYRMNGQSLSTTACNGYAAVEAGAAVPVRRITYQDAGPTLERTWKTEGPHPQNGR